MKYRILNLEDNKQDAELNEAMILAQWPASQLMRVDTRGDFIAALEHEDLDLILSDYTMPHFNGLEALSLARERRPEVPFMFVSGTIGEDAAIEALKNGATDYVLKGRLGRLVPAIQRALQGMQVESERERAEESIRLSEYKYRTLFEALGDGAFLVDESTGEVVDVNDTATSMVGLPREKILGRDQYDFLALDQDGAQSRRIPECAMLCADGRTVPVEIHNSWLVLHGKMLVLRLCHYNAQRG